LAYTEELISEDLLQTGRDALGVEARAILRAAQRLDQTFVHAVQIISECQSKVVVSGIGKSGRIGEKIAATLCSTGTPAVFLHPAEAAHGDLGVYIPGDPTLMISKSGTTQELLSLLPVLRELKSPLIGLLGSPEAPLARELDVVLDASVQEEADPHNVAPTASTTVALAIGDALAIAVMRARDFTLSEFARNHPHGMLGRNLRLAVADVMHQGDEVAWVRPRDSVRDVIVAMTEHPLGAACVVDSDRRLEGLITDGDLRRALRTHDDIRGLGARDIMTRHPVTVSPTAKLHEALRMMEDRSSQISVLPVVDGRCLGLVRIHDVYHGRVAK
jgi:arabinose-5-phosphate isomerase